MNNIKDSFAALLGKEMDRKEFLRYIAATGLILSGVGVILQPLTRLRQNTQVSQKTSNSYGGGVYGGSKQTV